MIAGLSGTLLEKQDKSAIIDVQGVRYEVFMNQPGLGGLPERGAPIELWTRLIPGDDAMTLFGFVTQSQQQLFDLLVKVTGVGPRLALNILGAGPVNEIANAIVSETPEYFLKVTRLGKKTASKIILDLKSKVEQLFPAAQSGAGPVTPLPLDADIALQALVELGYNSAQAKDALSQVTTEDPSARVKEALQKLGSQTTVTR